MSAALQAGWTAEPRLPSKDYLPSSGVTAAHEVPLMPYNGSHAQHEREYFEQKMAVQGAPALPVLMQQHSQQPQPQLQSQPQMQQPLMYEKIGRPAVARAAPPQQPVPMPMQMSLSTTPQVPGKSTLPFEPTLIRNATQQRVIVCTGAVTVLPPQLAAKGLQPMDFAQIVTTVNRIKKESNMKKTKLFILMGPIWGYLMIEKRLSGYMPLREKLKPVLLQANIMLAGAGIDVRVLWEKGAMSFYFA